MGQLLPCYLTATCLSRVGLISPWESKAARSAAPAHLKSSATVPVVIILTVVGAGMLLSCPQCPPRLTRTTHYAHRTTED